MSKIAMWSNAPHCGTGYGTQTAQLTKRLKADGYDVAVLANYGMSGSPMESDGIAIFPAGLDPYSLDADATADIFFEGKRGLIISLYDVWPMEEGNKGFFKKHDAWYWTPIDHAPVPPKVAAWASSHNTIAMADFGREQLTLAGYPPAYTIPHGIETSVFKPTPSDARTQLEIPEDGHLTTVVMANIGQIPLPRKMWFENLLAWRIFAERHEDAYLYLHTQLRNPRGVDLASFLKMWGLPLDRVRIVDQPRYLAGMLTPEYLAATYTASDVTLMATAGEGFGIPAVESAACGTPVIGSNFSAQKQTVCGWKVDFVSFFDYSQGAAQVLPLVSGIVDALEESYEVRGGRKDECLEFSRQFDADRIYAEQWRPFLADREKPALNRQQRRAQKRGKK